MAKRTHRPLDTDRTGLLGLDELYVLNGRGDRNNFFAWQHEHELNCCPLCGGKAIKIQDHFAKTYLDYIVDSGHPRVIRLTHEFFKYRCLNEKCRHIFSKEIGFASKFDNVTYRLENEIARKVIEGYSYSLVQGLFQDTISRQAVGQIFHRWTQRKESARAIQDPPSSLAILTGHAGENRYTLFLNLDDGIRVFDVLLGVDSADIGSVIQKLVPGVGTVITDCDPTINDAVANYLPSALHIIPVELWLRPATELYQEFAHIKIKWCPVARKDSLIMIPRSRINRDEYDLERLLAARPEVKPAYEDYSRLRGLIERRGELWVYAELKEWADSVCDDTNAFLAPSLYLLKEYRSEIEAQTQHRKAVPARLAEYVSELEDLLSQAKTFSEDILKARVLYAVDTDLQDWRGVPIQNVIQALQDMGLATKRKRREPNEYQ
ncbi:MAG: transposase [Paludibacteraceae bacterium]|nr:transposase [Paludibacteraceae bacterium]